jgi:prevent-host-death family protein
MNTANQKEPLVTVTASDLSNRLAEFLNKAGFQGSKVTILRYGKPFAMLVPLKEDRGENMSEVK